MPRRTSKLNRSYILKGFLFLLPAFSIYLIFAVIPVADSLILSFQKWNGFSARTFVGLENYIKVFKDRVFLDSIRNSVYIGALSSTFSVVIGMIMAWLLLFVPTKSGNFYRTILFSPSMMPSIITALVFSFVYEPEIGILNNLLGFLRLDVLKTAWLVNKATVLNSITFVSIWKQIGLTMVLCFAGMQSISPSLLESAYIEGASNLQIFRKIIIPLIMPLIQLSTIFALMSGLKIYDTVLALTSGGPGTFSMVMPMRIVERTFTHNQYGPGSSMSIVFVLVVLFGSLVVKRLIKGTSHEQ